LRPVAGQLCRGQRSLGALCGGEERCTVEFNEGLIAGNRLAGRDEDVDDSRRCRRAEHRGVSGPRLDRTDRADGLGEGLLGDNRGGRGDDWLNLLVGGVGLFRAGSEA
jgi:hypothetical protein